MGNLGFKPRVLHRNVADEQPTRLPAPTAANARRWIHVVRPSRLLVFYLLGLAATVGIAWIAALRVDPRAGLAEQASGAGDDTVWTVTRWRSRWAVCVDSLRQRGVKRPWGPEQVIGPPNTTGPGDIQTAWASRTQDDQAEWLIAEYARPVVASCVRVYETYNPGALVRVSVFSPAGDEVVVWQGADPAPLAARNIAELPVTVPFETRRVKIYLDSPAVRGWNEIDAIGLIDLNGGVQWATRVEASSSYADASGGGTTDGPRAIVPAWSGLATPTPAFESDGVEQRAVAGFGWPCAALWCDYPAGSSGRVPVFSPVVKSMRGTAAAAGADGVVLPYRPIWAGLVLDAGIYSVAVWLGLWALTRPARVVREVLRMRRGHCPRCGYDLRYDFARGCPECGLLRGEERAGA